MTTKTKIIIAIIRNNYFFSIKPITPPHKPPMMWLNWEMESILVKPV